MNILMPMAGEGQRFKQAGYHTSKPAILTYDRRTGKKLPMVVCAAMDLPDVSDDGSNVIYVERTMHQTDGTENEIRTFYPKARFIAIDRLTEGQACTCLLAEEWINNDDELLIAGCDNGMEFNMERFDSLRKSTDVIVFTCRHNEAVLGNPNDYGWMLVEKENFLKENLLNNNSHCSKEDGCNNRIVDVSIKKAISDHPLEDHAVVAAFWFRKGGIFVESAKRMINANDRVNGEFYVDQVIRHALDLGYDARVFEVDRYIGWGTPADHEAYQNTFEYWDGFCKREIDMISYSMKYMDGLL